MDEATLNAACKRLLSFGWRLAEIEQLLAFRKNYVQTDLDQADLDIRQLEFIRWLVLNGRLEG
jgi:hypothetical protein